MAATCLISWLRVIFLVQFITSTDPKLLKNFYALSAIRVQVDQLWRVARWDSRSQHLPLLAIYQLTAQLPSAWLIIIRMSKHKSKTLAGSYYWSWFDSLIQKWNEIRLREAPLLETCTLTVTSCCPLIGLLPPNFCARLSALRLASYQQQWTALPVDKLINI